MRRGCCPFPSASGALPARPAFPPGPWRCGLGAIPKHPGRVPFPWDQEVRGAPAPRAQEAKREGRERAFRSRGTRSFPPTARGVLRAGKGAVPAFPVFGEKRGLQSPSYQLPHRFLRRQQLLTLPRRHILRDEAPAPDFDTDFEPLLKSAFAFPGQRVIHWVVARPTIPFPRFCSKRKRVPYPPAWLFELPSLWWLSWRRSLVGRLFTPFLTG